MNLLSTFDYIIIGGYFLLMLIIGFALKARASKSIEHYLIGGKTLPWWALGLSGMATNLDISGTMLIVSFVYMLGPKGLFIEFRGGAVLTLIVMMIWTGKWHRRSGVMTASDWLIFRFGDNWGGRFAELARVAAAVIGTIGTLSYLIVGAGIFFSMFLPFTPFQCALILVGITTLYTTLSGFYGVVASDVIQALFIWVGVVAISVIAFTAVSEAGNINEIANTVTGNKEWASSMPKWNTYMPQGYEVFSHLTLFMTFYLMRNIFGGMGMGDDPKFFGAKSERECGKLSFIWTTTLMFRWPMIMGFAVLGLFMVNDLFADQNQIVAAADIIRQYVPDSSKADWTALLSNIIKNPEQFDPNLILELQSFLQLVSYEGTVNPERILPGVIIHNLQSGLRGVIMAALIAAGMSTFNTKVNESTGFIVRNIYQRYVRPGASNKEIIYMSYLVTILVVVISFLFAFNVKSINDIWGWIAMGLGGGLLIPTILRLYWWRFNGGGFAIGTITGLIAAVAQRFVMPDLDDISKFLIIAAVGLVGTVIGTLFTKPTDPEVLENFYLKTRPFGFWKPLKKLLTKDQKEAMEKEHKNDLRALPFGILFHTTLFLWPMQIIIHDWNAFFITFSICATGAIGLYFFWYRNLPDDVINFRKKKKISAKEVIEPQEA